MKTHVSNFLYIYNYLIIIIITDLFTVGTATVTNQNYLLCSETFARETFANEGIFWNNLGQFLENKGIFYAEKLQSLFYCKIFRKFKIKAKFREINFREWVILNFSLEKQKLKFILKLKLLTFTVLKVGCLTGLQR